MIGIGNTKLLMLNFFIASVPTSDRRMKLTGGVGDAWFRRRKAYVLLRVQSGIRLAGDVRLSFLFYLPFARFYFHLAQPSETSGMLVVIGK